MVQKIVILSQPHEVVKNMINDWIDDAAVWVLEQNYPKILEDISKANT